MQRDKILERRLREAEESLSEAKFLMTEEVSNTATVAKLYHTMIYSLLAIFGIEDIGNLTHADLIERFKREYLDKGIFPMKFSAALNRAYDLTHECDCVHMKEPSERDVAFLYPEAENFYDSIKRYLTKSAGGVA